MNRIQSSKKQIQSINDHSICCIIQVNRFIHTWFVAVAYAEHGENQNESQEEFQAQALQRCKFRSQSCMT